MKYIKKFESIEWSTGETKYLQYAPSENTVKDYFIAELEDNDNFDLLSVITNDKTINKLKSYTDTENGIQYYLYHVTIEEFYIEPNFVFGKLQLDKLQLDKIKDINDKILDRMCKKYEFIINVTEFKTYWVEGGYKLVIELKFYFEDPTYQNFRS